jgi:hypothetical protein
LDIQQTFETKRQQIHTLQEGLPFGEVPAAPKTTILRHCTTRFESCATLFAVALAVRLLVTPVHQASCRLSLTH